MAEDAQRRRMAIAVGVAGLVVGLALGAAAGGGKKTVTDTQTVVSTATETVPVVHTRTVVHTRRVVRTRTQTITVHDAPVQASPPSSSGSGSASDGSQYAGMNCAEIGHSFNVTPGSDPEHDADNDGVACESYPP